MELLKTRARGSAMGWKLMLMAAMIAVLLWAGGLWTHQEPRLALTILHTNDVHSHYLAPSGAPTGSGGAARLATLIDGARAEARHTLLLDAGDQFQGSLLFTVGGPDVVADVMNALGYDAMTVGNHEFDLGPAGLARLIARAQFSVLSANIDATAEATLDGDVRPFDVFLFDGEVVGVFGLTTEATMTASSPGADIVFEPVARRARSVVEMLERQGVNKIIALTHLGYSEDLKLAATVDGIDVIVGGHSHTQLSPESDSLPYPTWVASGRGEPVVVVSDGEWGQTLGRLDLVFDAAGRVVEASGVPISASADTAEDSGVVALLVPYAARAQELVGEALGSSAVNLDGERARVRSAETNLGDLIADAMLAKTEALGAQVALMNGGGIRASIPKGNVTMGQILEALPFGNEITTVTTTGRDLIAALENGVSQVETGAGRFPQVAGLRFSFDPTAPAGSRVQQVELWESKAMSYRSLSPDEIVAVATNDFLAGGGDGYATLATGGRYDTGWLLADVLAEHVRQISPVTVETAGRIRRAGTP